MTTLSPLQVNDAKRAGLDDYFRAVKIKSMHYDAIALNCELKHRIVPEYLMLANASYESANLQNLHCVSNH